MNSNKIILPTTILIILFIGIDIGVLVEKYYKELFIELNKNIFSAFIGALFSVPISLYFYKKTIPLEKHIKSITNNIESIYIREKYPTMFSPTAYHWSKKEIIINNDDKPYVIRFISEKNKILINQKILILIRCADLGYNFPFMNGISVKSTNMIFEEVRFDGFGWYSFYATSQTNENIEIYIELKDNAGNLNTQVFSLNV